MAASAPFTGMLALDVYLVVCGGEYAPGGARGVAVEADIMKDLRASSLLYMLGRKLGRPQNLKNVGFAIPTNQEAV